MQKTDKFVFLMWDCTCELREWEWFFQQLLAGGQSTAQGSPQTFMWGQSHRVSALRFVFPFFPLQWSLCWQLHGKRQLYFCQWLQHTLYPKVSKARSESLRLNTLRQVWRRLTPYGLSTRIGKPPVYFILSIFSLEYSSAHSTVQENTHTPQDCSCSGAEHQCRQEQGWPKTPALRPAAARHSSGSETAETVEKPLFAVADEMKRYCPLRFSLCSAAQIQLLLHPQQCFVPVSAQGLLSLLYLILHCHRIHRNCSSQTSADHIEQTRTTKKTLHSPPWNKGKVWREEMFPPVF